MAATIDEISGGRFVLGVGAGWNEVEFRGFGLPYDHRVSRFEEAWTIIRRLLAGERVTFEGRFTTAHDLVLLPEPSRRVPLMLGSVGPRMQSIALPHADAWNAWYGRFGNTAEGFAEENAKATRSAQEAGRDPSEIRRSACILVALDGAPDRPGPPALTLEGDPGRLAEVLGDFARAGADEVIVELDQTDEPSIRRFGQYLAQLG
jgi:alkanesulfonate monooxygenase SsuD/methylene tetrahydromethanopterin reductase-like flavin-dependent oxidoreductase (luciferase family)